jgi:hypothetical protein
MPANVTDMAESLRVGRKDGKPIVVRNFIVTGLTGATDWERLAQALTMTSAEGTHTGDDIPKDGEQVIITIEVGKPIKMYANGFDVQPWGESDAIVIVEFNTTKRGNFDVVGFGPTIKELGSTAEQEETEFDYENLQLPFGQRTPIKVTYNGKTTGQPIRVTRFAGKPVMTFIREQTIDPEDLAREYVSFVNSTPWRGYDAGTILCVAIVGRDEGTGIWKTTYQFAHSKYGWKQYARYIDDTTHLPPELTPADLSNSNGITEVTVQGEKDFTALNIPA